MTGRIEALVAAYYAEKVASHGETPAGVDWNSAESQEMRFDKLLEVVGSDRSFSLLDYGCGWGALVDRLRTRGLAASYVGFDVAEEMVARARARYGGVPDVAFTNTEADLARADYVVASGIFNVRLAVAEDEWRAYVLATLARLDALSERGFAFNVLSLYSDAEKRRADLHYADPREMFDHCKRSFSRYVALLHDYPLYEFTILVTKAVR